jgi:small-conductance mechanosensitive channel/CRP-like cAMP-binding protein
LSAETWLFITTLVLVGASIALMAVVGNHVIRRRLLFTVLVLGAAAVLRLAIAQWPQVESLRDDGWKLQSLLIALATINAVVTLVFNRWFRDAGPDRAPAIVQDTVIAALGLVAALFLFRNASFLTGSAIVAAVIGFALQDTLGNAFAGIAIQIEKPFRVGHWIAVASHTGLVTEVTWRATKLRTKAGNLVSLPNSLIAKEAINNYSEPTAPTRLEVDVGAAYQTPPNDVRDALIAAMRGVPLVLVSPPPDVILREFAGSAITYRVRFWVSDFSKDDEAMHAARTAIYYEFRRRNIEIPWPIQIEYSREESPIDTPERRERFRLAIARVPVLAGLPEEAHRALAASADELLYAGGEVIVREGDPGESMFVVSRGTVVIAVGADRREVAVTQAGGYFGEMSLLTGEPRSATVIARGDCTVLEIAAGAFREFVQSHPGAIDQLAEASLVRRRELERTRSAAESATAAESVSLRDRMRKFFGL